MYMRCILNGGRTLAPKPSLRVQLLCGIYFGRKQAACAEALGPPCVMRAFEASGLGMLARAYWGVGPKPKTIGGWASTRRQSGD